MSIFPEPRIREIHVRELCEDTENMVNTSNIFRKLPVSIQGIHKEIWGDKNMTTFLVARLLLSRARLILPVMRVCV